MNNFLRIWIVLGDTVSKLETFVWIWNRFFKVHNLVVIQLNNTKLGQMTNLNMIFYTVVSVYKLYKIFNLNKSPAQPQTGL